VVTTAAVTKPSLLGDISARFGAKCLVAGIDYRRSSDGGRVWIRSGAEPTSLNPLEHAQQLVKMGAGEILLNCIDLDGKMEGYDLAMAEKISQGVPVPVIVSGGAGNFMHLGDLFNKTSASAAACASLFHFGDNNPIRARSYLRNLSIPMRVLK
jgi:cyclase